MTIEHRYQLEKGSKKHPCPGCGKKRFVRYTDTRTGHHLPERYGRCDRETSCAYHLNPYKDGFSLNVWEQERTQAPGSPKPARKQPGPPPAPDPASFIPVELFRQSRAGYSRNNFALYLARLFGPDVTGQLISRYHVGTSQRWPGATVFWRIDRAGRITAGKVMLYHPETGRRDKQRFTSAHKALNIEGPRPLQGFFGEHLLRQAGPVAVVESEKTAIIASAYLPRFLWLAVGGLSFLTAQRCQALQGRTVILFPDLNGFEKWSTTAKDLTSQLPGTRFEVSALLEHHSTEAERVNGLDLADYLTRFNWRTFSQQPETAEMLANVGIKTPGTIPVTGPEPGQMLKNVDIQTESAPAAPAPESEKGEKGEAPNKTFFQPPRPPGQVKVILDPTSENFSLQHVAELENYFAGAALPPAPLRLCQGTTVANVGLFVSSHLAYLKANPGTPAFLPYLERLNRLKEVLTLKAA